MAMRPSGVGTRVDKPMADGPTCGAAAALEFHISSESLPAEEKGDADVDGDSVGDHGGCEDEVVSGNIVVISNFNSAAITHDLKICFKNILILLQFYF